MDNFEKYLSKFNYASLGEISISSKELVNLLPAGNVDFIDIRFKEEYAIWHFGFSKNIPLNELPQRLTELDTNKLIVTACPKSVRSNIAMHYLITKDFNVKFLSDGLTTLKEILVGENARDLHDLLNAE